MEEHNQIFPEGLQDKLKDFEEKIQDETQDLHEKLSVTIRGLQKGVVIELLSKLAVDSELLVLDDDSIIKDPVLVALSTFAIKHEIPKKFNKYIIPSIHSGLKENLVKNADDIVEPLLRPRSIRNDKLSFFMESSLSIFDIQAKDKVALILDSKVGPFFYHEFYEDSLLEYDNDILKCQEFATCKLNAAEILTYNNFHDLITTEERFDKIILGHVENEELSIFNQNVRSIFDDHLYEGGKVAFSVANNVLNYVDGNGILDELAFRDYLVENRYVTAVKEYKYGAYVICSKENNHDISMSYGWDKLDQVEADAYVAVMSSLHREQVDEYMQMSRSDVAKTVLPFCPTSLKYENILPCNVLSPKFYWANEATHCNEGVSLDFMGEEIVTTKLSHEIEYEDKLTPKYFYEIVQYGPTAVQNINGQYIVSGLHDDYTKIKYLTRTCLEERFSRGYIIEHDCILARFRKDKMSFVYVPELKELGVERLLSDINTIPFKKKRTNLDKKYLLRILQKQVTSQLIILKDFFHANETYLTPWAFMSLKIKYPRELSRQKELVEFDYSDSVNKLEKEIEVNNEKYRKTIRMRKHSLGQDLFNLQNWWDELKDAKKNGVLNDSDVIERFKTFEVREIFDRIENSINIIKEKVSRFTVGDELEYDIISFPEFIADYISKHESPLFNYETELVDAEQLILNRKRCVKFPREALITILDNIVSNACAHGFIGRDNNNLIKIVMELEHDQMFLRVSNNGCPINNTLKEDDIFTWGRTSQVGFHSGIGGAEIKYLMDSYQKNIPSNERVRMIFDDSSDFPVQYVLKFELVDGGNMDMYY